MISVIVPVYNVGKYLRKCLDSIIGQTYGDLEIILIDDGSTDDSGRICDEYSQADRRIKVVHQENKGLSGARNAGLRAACGEYITFVDSDDHIEPRMYEIMAGIMKKDNCDIVMCCSRTVSESGELIAKDAAAAHLFVGEELIESIVLPLKTAVWNKLFKANLLEGASFPEGVIHGEDLVFLSKVINGSTRIYVTEYVGYNYVKRSGSITTSSVGSHSFDEVYCKDAAAEMLSKSFPELSLRFERWRFRARLNLIRKIYSAPEYRDKYLEYLSWLKDNYRRLRNRLTKKDRVEYRLLLYFPSLYRRVFTTP